MPAVPALSDPKRAALVAAAGLALSVGLLALWWPLGVAVGIAAGALVVLAVGGALQRAADAQPQDRDLEAALGLVVQPATAVPAPAPVATRTVAVPAPVQHAPVVQQAPVVQPAPVVQQAPAWFADEEPQVPAPADSGVREDLDRLKAGLGDDFPDFARAARLVVETQYASAARLQRELKVPYSRARRLLDDLETEHFVGPATGSLPRVVLVPEDRLPDVDRMFALA